MKRWLAGLILVFAAACSGNSDPSCTECGPNAPCPNGFECRPGTVCNTCVQVAMDAGHD